MSAATKVPTLEPGSPEWLRYMSGSKIAAVMGLSSYESRYSLYHRMAGRIPNPDSNTIQRRGHYLEPVIRQWFSDQHPDWRVTRTTSWINNTRPWQSYNPDGIVYTHPGRALVECKSAHEDDVWGTPGSDEIPIGFRCQGMWGMDTLGLDTCYFALLNRHLTFVEYVIHYDPAEAALLRERAAMFLDDLDHGRWPDIDSSNATYQAVRQMHPDIDPGGRIELPPDLAEFYLDAKDGEKTAADQAKLATSLVADRMGRAQYATYAGRTVASRQAKNGGTPYVTVARAAKTPATSLKEAV